MKEPMEGFYNMLVGVFLGYVTSVILINIIGIV